MLPPIYERGFIVSFDDKTAIICYDNGEETQVLKPIEIDKIDL